jgi:hypothetical protein
VATPDQEAHGRCVSCGFLSFYGWATPELRSVTRDWRESGILNGLTLACFRQAADLYDESYDASAAVPDDEGNYPSPTADKILAVIRRDRSCPDWFPFQAGLTPKEHLERMNAMELEHQRQALQVRLAEMERASRASSEKIEADSLEIATAVKSFTTKWTYVAAGLAFAVLAVTLLIRLGIKA